MTRFLTLFLLATPMLCAQGDLSNIKKNPVSLLPDGSVLKGVLLPRYDKDRHLVGDMKAETMTLIDSERVRGENVRVRFFHRDRSLRGKVEMKNVLFDQGKSRIFANEPLEITSDRLIAQGSGLVYSLRDGEGFLKGPASTRIFAPATATSMNRKTLPSAALAALSLVAEPVVALPPAVVSEKELAVIKSESATAKQELSKRSEETQASLDEAVAQGEKASGAAREFISTSEVKHIAAQEPAGEAKPLEVKPSPEDTLISSEGGMYFDSDEGVLVYLGNVKVTDPRFHLSGAQELKVFFAKKPAKKGSKEPSGMGDFGEVQKIVAEGAVLIEQKGLGGKEPVQASGSVLSFHIPTGEIIIHGGYPWVKQGSYYTRAKEPNLTLRLLSNGSFSTQGNWEMGGNLNLKGN